MLPVTETRKRFTVAEFDRMVEVGILGKDDRLELIDGEILEMNPIGPPHNMDVDILNLLLVPAAQQIGAYPSVGGALVLGDDGEVYPDLAVRRGTPHNYGARHPTAADVLLVVEVTDSSLTRDRDVKLPRYARAGVPEVWLVDVEHSLVLVYSQPGEDGYRAVRVLRPGETLRSNVFPEQEFSVSEMLGL